MYDTPLLKLDALFQANLFERNFGSPLFQQVQNFFKVGPH